MVGRFTDGQNYAVGGRDGQCCDAQYMVRRNMLVNDRAVAFGPKPGTRRLQRVASVAAGAVGATTGS